MKCSLQKSLVYLIISILFSIHLFGTMIKSIESPCPLCNNSCQYSVWMSGSSGFFDEFVPPFLYSLMNGPSIFHCNHCGFTLFAYHFECTFGKNIEDQNKSYFLVNPLATIKKTLNDQHLQSRVEPAKKTPQNVQYEIMEQIYKDLEKNKLYNGDVNNEGSALFWYNFYADMARLYVAAKMPAQARIAAQKALAIKVDESLLSRRLTDEQIWTKQAALNNLSGNKWNALKYYQKSLDWQPIQRIKDRSDENYLHRMVANNLIMKELYYALKVEKPSIGMLAFGTTMIGECISQINLPILLRIFFAWVFLFSVLFFIQFWHILKSAIAIGFTIYFLYFYVQIDSYFGFFFIALFWLLLTVLAEKLLLSNSNFIIWSHSKTWNYQRLVIIFSPLLAGLFHLESTFSWIPSLIDWKLSLPSYFGESASGVRMEIAGRILFYSLLFLALTLIWFFNFKLAHRIKKHIGIFISEERTWLKYLILSLLTILLTVISAFILLLPFKSEWRSLPSAYHFSSYFTNYSNVFNKENLIVLLIQLIIPCIAVLIVVWILHILNKLWISQRIFQSFWQNKLVKGIAELNFILILLGCACGSFHLIYSLFYSQEYFDILEFPISSLYYAPLSPYFYLSIGLVIAIILAILKIQLFNRLQIQFFSA